MKFKETLGSLRVYGLLKVVIEKLGVEKRLKKVSDHPRPLAAMRHSRRHPVVDFREQRQTLQHSYS
jgi:hypothetical protein